MIDIASGEVEDKISAPNTCNQNLRGKVD